MYPTAMTLQLNAIRHAELIASADAARRAGRARRTERRSGTAPLRNRIWMRTATQPAQI